MSHRRKKKLVKVCAAFQVTATPSPFAKTLISSLGVAVMREPLASEKKKKKHVAVRRELRGETEDLRSRWSLERGGGGRVGGTSVHLRRLQRPSSARAPFSGMERGMLGN